MSVTVVQVQHSPASASEVAEAMEAAGVTGADPKSLSRDERLDPREQSRLCLEGLERLVEALREGHHPASLPHAIGAEVQLVAVLKSLELGL